MNPLDVDLDLIKGELSRRSLKEFVKLFWPFVEPGSPFIDGWVIDAVCDHLANLKQIKNLLINCPPRVGKSNYVAVFYPAWRWLHNPSEKFLYSCYAIQLAERDSVKCRRLIESDLFQKCFGQVFRLTDDQNTKRRYANNRNGERLVSSIEGSTTGEGGTVLCLDDPHAVDEADSEAKRNTTIRWFTDTWLSRLNPGGTGRIVIGQRIHKDDLSGYILANYASEWTHLNLPYEYRPTTVTTCIGWKDPRTEEGQELWPERFSRSEINQLKRKPRAWSSQYNQNPVDAGNCLFKPEFLSYYDETDSAYVLASGKKVQKSDCWQLMAADLAIAVHNRADYTAIVVADISSTGDIFVKHIFRDRIPGTKLVQQIQAVNDTFRPAYILLEDVAFQKVIIDQARAEGLPVRGIRPGGDKEARSIPLQVRWENKQVHLPKDRPWVQLLERELLEFPNGSHDDMVDALAYIADQANRRIRTRKAPEQEVIQTKTPAQLYNEAILQGLF